MAGGGKGDGATGTRPPRSVLGRALTGWAERRGVAAGPGPRDGTAPRAQRLEPSVYGRACGGPCVTRRPPEPGTFTPTTRFSYRFPNSRPHTPQPRRGRPQRGTSGPTTGGPPAPGPGSPRSPRCGLGPGSKAAPLTPGFLDGGGPCHVAPRGRQPAQPPLPSGGPRCPPPACSSPAPAGRWPQARAVGLWVSVTRLVTDTASSPTSLWVLSHAFAPGFTFPRCALLPDPVPSPLRGPSPGRPQGARLCAGQPQASLSATWGRVGVPPFLQRAPQGRDPQCPQHPAGP